MSGPTQPVRTAICVIVVALLAVGCQADVQPAPEEENNDVSRLEPAVVTVETTGSVALRWEGETDLRIVVLLPVEASVQLFSLGLEDMHEVGDEGEYFRFALDVLGGYDGPGTYEIPAVSGTATEARSSAFLSYVRLADPAADPPYSLDDFAHVAEFHLPRQACVVEVTAKAEAEGSLVCPELADADGNIVELRVTWRSAT